MLGVVLWSDANDRKAVIWCEDHGDLAYYSCPDPAGPERFALDAGDLVQFDLTSERRARFAHNPRLISDVAYRGLPEALVPPVGNDRPAPAGRICAEVIPFGPRQGPMQRRTALSA